MSKSFYFIWWLRNFRVDYYGIVPDEKQEIKVGICLVIRKQELEFIKWTFNAEKAHRMD